MISPHTPPGAKVVCIDADEDRFVVSGKIYHDGLSGLRDGVVYTVREIVEAPSFAINRFAVVLCEIDREASPFMHPFNNGFALERFRRVTDISDLQKLAVTAPRDAPAELEPA